MQFAPDLDICFKPFFVVVVMVVVVVVVRH